MRTLSAIAVLAAGWSVHALQEPPPRDWIDPATGHRVVRLTDDAGGSTLYFHDNAFSPEGDRLMFNTPQRHRGRRRREDRHARTRGPRSSPPARAAGISRDGRARSTTRAAPGGGRGGGADGRQRRHEADARGDARARAHQRRRDAVGREERQRRRIPTASTRARRCARPCRSSSACSPASAWKI